MWLAKLRIVFFIIIKVEKEEEGHYEYKKIRKIYVRENVKGII